MTTVVNAACLWVALGGICSFAQEIPQSTATAISPQEAAQNVRLHIVELASAEFGADLMNDWNHPKTPYPTQADTFVMAFTKLLAAELSANRPDNTIVTNVKSASRASGSFSLLARVLGGALGPAGDAVGYAADAASHTSIDSGPPSNLVEAHLREVDAVAKAVLSPTDYQAYSHAAETGDYVIQTSLLMKMDHEVLNRQPSVNPYILWWCDMRGRDGRKGSQLIETDEPFFQNTPLDNRFQPTHWWALTEEARWAAVDELLNRFFQTTSEQLADPAQRASALALTKPDSEVKRPRGSLLPDGAEVNREYVAALGPKALEKYDHAAGEEKLNLIRTSMLFVGGVNSLLSMLLGAPDLKVDGTTAPVANHR